MEPHVLRNNLARFFNVFLTPKQIGALAEHFDKDNDGTVDGMEFLKGCNSLWQEVDNDAMQKNIMSRQKLKVKQERYDKLHAEKIARELNSIQLTEFKESDVVSSMKKLREAAIKYDARVNISLQGFQGAPMNPYQFKDLLKRVLKLNLTIPELSCLMAHFDADGDGTGALFTVSLFHFFFCISSLFLCTNASLKTHCSPSLPPSLPLSLPLSLSLSLSLYLSIYLCRCRRSHS